MNLHKFYLDSQLHTAILSLFNVPIEELTGKLRENMIIYRNNHPFDFETNGKPCAIQFFKECLRGEVMKYIENNEKINQFLMEND